MSAKVIAQMLVSGVQVLMRASVSAYQQALRNAKNPGAQANPLTKKNIMPLDQALAILNLEQATVTQESLDAAFKKFFELNDPAKGGSFYLQSKIYRANEAAQKELGYVENEDEDSDSDSDDDDDEKAEDKKQKQNSAEKEKPTDSANDK